MIELLPIAEAVPDPGMYELMEKILHGVSFIAIGGAIAVMFILIFAQTIIGSRSIQSQLQQLLKHTEKISEQLAHIAESLTKGDPRKRQ